MSIQGELGEERGRAEAAKEIKALYNAAKAFQDLGTCYRLGKRPTEALFTKLEKANKIMEKYKGI